MDKTNIFLIVLIFVVGLSFFSYFNKEYSGHFITEPEKCESSESLSIFEPHSVSYWSEPGNNIPPQVYTSACATSTTVTSVKCIDGARPEKLNVDCPTGYICSNDGFGGYCKRGNAKGLTSTGCFDTDEGNIYEKGLVVLIQGRGKNMPERFVDICATDTTVTEFTCIDGDNNVDKRILGCPYPYTCSGGACIKS